MCSKLATLFSLHRALNPRGPHCHSRRAITFSNSPLIYIFGPRGILRGSFRGYKSLNMEFEDYESLPSGSIGVHMTAGALAGVMEHCVMYPIDSVKTRMQSLSPSPEAAYRSIREGLVKMVSAEGMMRPLGGVTAVVIGAGPAHALYFSAYEGIKARFTTNNSLQNHIVNAGAGCGATVLHDAIMVPADVIKQRMQMYNSPYSSCYDCMRKLYRLEGLGAFYRSFTTQMAMNLPFHAIHIATYEKIQTAMNPSRDYNPRVHMLAGAAAGAVAAAFTTPLDMCKTVLNTQEASALVHLQQAQVVGIWGAIRTIYGLNGVSGFFKGIRARVLYQMPGTAISWSVYELFKHLMTRENPPQWDSEIIKDGVLREGGLGAVRPDTLVNNISTERNERSTDRNIDRSIEKDPKSVLLGSLINMNTTDRNERSERSSERSDRSERSSEKSERSEKEKTVITLGSATNKNFERLRSLHMPTLTANCTAADDNWLSK